MMDLPVDYVSHSQMSLYSFCPKAYWYKYLDKSIKEKPNCKLTFGSAIHGALEYNFRHKLMFGEDRPISDVAAYFLDRWAKHKYCLYEEGETWAGHLTIGLALVQQYMERIAPSVRPLLIEQEHKMDLGDGLFFKVIIDNFTVDNILIDYKTAGKMWSQSKAREDMQLTGYTAAIVDKLGIWPVDAQIHCLVKSSKTEVKVVSGGPRAEYHIDAWKDTVHLFAENVSDGIFYKRTGSWLCHPARCAYYKECMG